MTSQLVGVAGLHDLLLLLHVRDPLPVATSMNVVQNSIFDDKLLRLLADGAFIVATALGCIWMMRMLKVVENSIVVDFHHLAKGLDIRRTEVGPSL